MNSKVLFFDVDGTLLSFNGKFPEDAQVALKNAKAKGHKLIICSGRNMVQMYPILLDFGFDGFVASTGAYAEIDGKEIHRVTSDHDELKKVIDVFEKNGNGLILQEKNASWSNHQGYADSIRTFDKRGTKQSSRDIVMNKMHFVDHLDPNLEIEKMYYNCASLTIDEVQEAIGDYFHVAGSSFGKNPDVYSGEITITGVSKAVGMEKVLEYYGLGPEDAIGFGDSENDIEMMEYAGYSVAMGNATETIKGLADYVTSDIDEGGIANALKVLNLC